MQVPLYINSNKNCVVHNQNRCIKEEHLDKAGQVLCHCTLIFRRKEALHSERFEQKIFKIALELSNSIEKLR